MDNTKTPLVAITAGDPNGIGYEVIIKSLTDPHITEVCTPVIYGNEQLFKEWQKQLGEEYAALRVNIIRNAEEAQAGKISLINTHANMALHIGTSTKEGGEASFAALNKACDDIKRGAVKALITAPINKENIQSDRFRFSGHTEYLANRFGKESESLMMMVSEQMKVALVCNHVPLRDVAEQITEERIVSKLKVFNESLIQDFHIRAPRIAVLALNPHAGDNGLLGTEEQTIIKPAIKQAYDSGILAFGPFTADGFFGSGTYAHFDATLAMYHDQGLIPFKSLDMNGVNYTAGLPVVRTSPDHGTAYDLAGKRQATHFSFANALYLALDILKKREITKEINKNPLPFKEQQPEKREPREFKGFNPAEARREREERQREEIKNDTLKNEN